MILSFHDFHRTPSPKELQRLFDQMVRLGADVIKIVPFARSWEDNLSILSLIPFAKRRRQRIVAFCMGEKGKISRIFSPFLRSGLDICFAQQGQGFCPRTDDGWRDERDLGKAKTLAHF